MGDIPKEKELVGKATENAKNGAANEVYQNLKELATSPTGFQEASKLLSDPSLKEILPAITLAYLKDGNNLNRWDTQDKDQTLSQSEANAAAQSGTFLDRAIMGSYLNSGTFSADANADGKPGLSAKDLEARSASVNAAQVARIYASDKDFQALDVTKEDGSAGKDGKVTKKDLQTIRTVGEEKLKDKNLSADDRAKIERSLSAIKQIESTFDQRSADGRSITYAEATGKPSERFNAPDAIQRTMSAHSTLDKDPNSKKTRFDDLATTEKVNGKDEQRISKTRLQDEINTLETRIKQNDGDVALHAANKAIYENMLKDFDKIHPAGKGDGDGMSMADIAAHKQRSELSANISKVFTDKELAEGITRDNVNTKLAQANADAALGLKSPLAASIETLQYLADDKHPENFDNIAKLGQFKPEIAPPVPKGGVPAPPVPNAGQPNDQTKIDSEDLKKLGADKTMLALPKDVQTPVTTTTDGSKPNEIQKSVYEAFKSTPVTEVNGTGLNIQNGRAVANYGPMKLGFQFDANNNVTAVFNSPEREGGAPGIFEKVQEANGSYSWYGRPNGLGKTEGQYKLPGDLDVDPKTGAFTRMLSGQMGADHKHLQNTAYQTFEGKMEGTNRVVSQYTMEADNTAYGFGYLNGSATPNRIDYKPSLAGGWEKLDRQADQVDVRGVKHTVYQGDITTTGGRQKYEMRDPVLEPSGTFSYYRPDGNRVSNLPDGSMWYNRPPEVTAPTTTGMATGETGVRDWHNGNKVFYSGTGFNITSFRYERTEGNAVQNQYYERLLDPNTKNQVVDGRGVPLWRSFSSRDASGNPINPTTVAFRPHVDASGKVTDTGRPNEPPPRPGYVAVFDWDANNFVYRPA